MSARLRNYSAWYAIACSADASPPLLRLRQNLGPLADAYYYRATAFCKLYRATGVLEGAWTDLAAFVRWEGTVDRLRQIFEETGIVDGKGELYDWETVNGWILERAERDRKRHENKRKAGVISARRRRERGRMGENA